MKRFSLALIALLAMSVLSVKAQQAKILLQHNGSATMYESDQLSTAITAAAAGDTIYLTKGTFSGDISVSKAISIIGVGGNSSIINGTLDIKISGTPTLTSTFMEGVCVKSSTTIKAAVNGLKMKKCQFTEVGFSANVEDFTLEQCKINSYFHGNSTYVKSATVLNSKIYYVYNDCTNTTFVNCNVYYIMGNDFNGNFLNSIICTGSYSSLSEGASFTNCLYYKSFTNANYISCYQSDNSSLISSDNLTCAIDDATLLSSGYLGNDGTIVGVNGGTTGYSLTPKVPTVESSTIKVDTENQKLNVSLKVKAN